MVNGGGLLQVPTAFSGRYVEFVQSSAFGQKRSTVVISDWGRSQITSTQSGHWLVITRKKMNFGAPDDGSSFTQFGFTFFAISHLSRAPVSAMVNVTTR